MIIENINEEKFKTHVKQYMAYFPFYYKSQNCFIDRIFVSKQFDWVNGEPDIFSLKDEGVNIDNEKPLIDGKYLDDIYKFGDLRTCFKFSNPQKGCLLELMPNKEHCNPFWFEKLTDFILRVNHTNPLTYKLWLISSHISNYGAIHDANKGLLERNLDDFEALRVLTNKLAHSHLGYGTIETYDPYLKHNEVLKEFLNTTVNKCMLYNPDETVSTLEKSINDLKSVINALKAR